MRRRGRSTSPITSAGLLPPSVFAVLSLSPLVCGVFSAGNPQQITALLPSSLFLSASSSLARSSSSRQLKHFVWQGLGLGGRFCQRLLQGQKHQDSQVHQPGHHLHFFICRCARYAFPGTGMLYATNPCQDTTDLEKCLELLESLETPFSQ
eukprot:3146941-Rhodomonas_salina.1